MCWHWIKSGVKMIKLNKQNKKKDLLQLKLSARSQGGRRKKKIRTYLLNLGPNQKCLLAIWDNDLKQNLRCTQQIPRCCNCTGMGTHTACFPTCPPRDSGSHLPLPSWCQLFPSPQKAGQAITRGFLYPGKGRLYRETAGQAEGESRWKSL